MSLLAFSPEDFDEKCETCGAAPGQLCHPGCDTGSTADDYRADAQRHADRPEIQPPRRRRTAPKESP